GGGPLRPRRLHGRPHGRPARREEAGEAVRRARSLTSGRGGRGLRGDDPPVQTETLRALRRELDLPGPSDRAQGPDGVPGHVQLPPGIAVPRGALEGVVVVVPALAPGVDADPPAVGRTLGLVVCPTNEGAGRSV